MGKDARTSLRGALYRGDGAAALAALDGRSPFRRFKDALARSPEELERYHELSDERCRGRARAWLADAGYRPVRPAEIPSGHRSP